MQVERPLLASETDANITLAQLNDHHKNHTHIRVLILQPESQLNVN